MNIDDQQPTDSILFTHFGKFQMTISLEHKIRSTSCFVQGWGFRGRQIERRYYVFAQIQDGGWRKLWKIQTSYLCYALSDSLYMLMHMTGDWTLILQGK